MKEVLLVSIGFSPNLGGIETHFDDLVKILDESHWRTWVLTYKPITTEAKANFYEKRGRNINIYRVPWFGDLFYKLVKNPIFEFLYLFPGLFCTLPIFLILKGRNIKVIHSHGLIAGFVSVFWGKVFGRRVITTTHSIYNFPATGLYRNFAGWIFKNSDQTLTLSAQSAREIGDLGVDKNKIKKFTYWVDLERFKKISNAKTMIDIKSDFIVFCASRLVEEKGIKELLDAASKWDTKITLLISSDGPLKDEVLSYQKKHKNIIYLGRLTQKQMPTYYSAADLFVIPSTHEEGFGRVILESLACRTPVIGSNRGAISEAMDNTVGRLINITPENIKNTVEYFFKNSDKLEKLSKRCRQFVEEKYSIKNAKTIIGAYK